MESNSIVLITLKFLFQLHILFSCIIFQSFYIRKFNSGNHLVEPLPQQLGCELGPGPRHIPSLPRLSFCIHQEANERRQTLIV